MKKILFLILIVFVSATAYADTTLTEDCSASAVNTAITNESAGGVVTIACSSPVTWNAQVNLSGGKTLSGGGTKSGAVNTTTGTWPIVINITHSGTTAVAITNAASQSVNRVTGFKFQGAGGPTYIISVSGVGVGSDSNGAFRIDNNYFNEPSYTGRVIRTDGSTGKMTGLLDHNIFYYKETSSPGYGNLSYQNNSHDAISTCYGSDAWQRPIGFGTDDFVFYEDNYFLNSGIETSEGGGKIVVRYNYYTSDYSGYFSALDGHGADTGGMYCIGVIAAEFYNNETAGSGMGHVVNMRGGKWMVFNNIATYGILQLEEYRLRSPGSLQWKACSGTFCCPTTPSQCDVQSPQISDFPSCYPVLNQVQDTYLWNNSGKTPVYSGDDEILQYYIVEDRDYWLPSSGTEANLPATCIDDNDTFYGATDSGKLWECTGTNTWTLKYTPYTYPHPLQGDDETPPLVSSATIQANGTDLVIIFNESITATDNAAFTLDPTGADVTVDCPAVETATNTMTCVISRAIQYSETAVYGYTGTNVVDTSANALATISNTPSVVNNSTQGITPGTATHSGGIFGGCVFQ